MTDKPLVSVVVPTFNEEDNIPLLLSDIGHALRDYAYEVIVVDDGTDSTWKIAIDMGARVIPGLHMGLGAAILDGIRRAKVMLWW